MLLARSLPGLEGFQEGIQLTGFGKIFVIDIGQVRKVDGFFLIPPDHHDILDAHCIVSIDNVGKDRCALNVDHRLGLLFGEFAQFIASGCGEHDGGRVFGDAGQIAFFSFLSSAAFCSRKISETGTTLSSMDRRCSSPSGLARFLHGGHGSSEHMIAPDHHRKPLLPEDLSRGGIIFGRARSQRGSIGPFPFESQNLVRN